MPATAYATCTNRNRHLPYRLENNMYATKTCRIQHPPLCTRTTRRVDDEIALPGCAEDWRRHAETSSEGQESSQGWPNEAEGNPSGGRPEFVGPRETKLHHNVGDNSQHVLEGSTDEQSQGWNKLTSKGKALNDAVAPKRMYRSSKMLTIKSPYALV